MITPQQIADAFNKAGVDTVEKVSAAVGGFTNQLEIQKIDIALAELSAARAEVLAPIENERIELQNRRAALADAIKNPAP